MVLFLSKFTNKIDKKGRVSVPSAYRLLLNSPKFTGVIVYPSFRHPCLEACSMERLESIYGLIDRMDPFSDDRDAFTTAILSEAVPLPFDSEGRIGLPELLIERANLSEQVLFVGKGATFELWEPVSFEGHAAEARERAHENRHLLSGRGGHA